MRSITRKTIILLLAAAGICCVLAAVFFRSGIGAPAQEQCALLDQSRQITCFADDVIARERAEGVVPALAVVKDSLETFPGLKSECHGVMHLMGEEAFRLYEEDRPIDVDPSIILCTYGFYHGFIDASVVQTGSYDPAREFCAHVDAELSKQGIEGQAECYHGFGHAVVDDHISTQFLSAHEVVQKALELCARLTDSDSEYTNCASGVFNAVANIFVDKTFPWPEIAQQDTRSFCDEQPDGLKLVCYGYFARVIFSNHGSDLEAALRSVSASVYGAYQRGVIENISLIFMSQENDASRDREAIGVCHGFAPEVSASCVGGLAVGALQSGGNAGSFHRGADICSEETLSADEHAFCFDRLAVNSEHLFSRSEFAGLCDSIPKAYTPAACEAGEDGVR